MPQHIPFIWIPELLAKAVIKRANSSSVANAVAHATLQYNRNAYIIKVLEASPGIREIVRNEVVAEHDNQGKRQLLAILTGFETLSPADKAAYIMAFKACATAAGQGFREFVLQNAWQSGQHPPIFEP